MKLVKINLKDGLAFSGMCLHGAPTLLGVPISQTAIIILLFILIFTNNKKMAIPYFLFFVFTFLVLNTFYFNVFDFDTSKMFIGLIIYFSAYLFYVYSYIGRVGVLIRKYMFVALFFCLIGIVQQVGYLLQIDYLYDISLIGFHVNNLSFSGPFIRSYGLFSETSHYAAFLTPAMFWSINVLINKDTLVSKKVSLLIILTFITTFSLIAYVNLFFVIVFFSYQVFKVNKIRGSLIAIICLAIFIPISLSDSVVNKANSVVYSIGDVDYITSSSGLSAFAMISNAQVMYLSLQENPLLGTGFNSHRFSYEKYIHKLYSDFFMEINSTGDSSLYIRILSEFGALGFLGYLSLLRYFYINKAIYRWKFINNSCFWIVLLITLRNGHYLHPLFLFLLSILIVTKVQFKREISYGKNYCYINNMVPK